MRIGGKDWPRGRFGSHLRREPDIPTASFGDLAFLLIIFFILTTTLVIAEGFATESPQGQPSHNQQDKTPTVTLTDGRVELDAKPVTLDELRDRLTEMDLRGRPESERVVLFEQTGEDRWQAFYEVYAIITATGGEAVIVLEEGDKR